MNKGLYINGQWVSAKGEMFSSLNPATNESLWEGGCASHDQVSEAVGAAKKAFESWALLSLEDRQAYLTQFASVLDQKKESLATAISNEVGKPYWESLTEVAAMIKKVAISINAFHDRCRQVEEPMGDARSVRRFKPHGVLAVFGPFNLPGHLPNGHIIPALLAGNTIVFKPSEQTPLVGQMLVESLSEAGFPAGVINLIHGSRQTGEALLSESDINGVYFTGSSKTGMAIHKQFGGHPDKILALEMGGNNPLIVDEAKNLDAAAYLTILSAFITSGQRCVCARRLILVDGPESEKFLKKLVMMSEQIKVAAHTERPEPFMGPVISEAMASTLLGCEEKLLAEGGRSLLKMTRLQLNGAMLTPGIMDVTDVKDKSDVEIFGPFLQVIRVSDFDEAVKEANQTSYGLSAGLISDNHQKYEKFLALSRAGIVNYNRQITGASSNAPFGGIGLSGNHQPSAYFAADYCSYPVASVESNELVMPENLMPGIGI